MGKPRNDTDKYKGCCRALHLFFNSYFYADAVNLDIIKRIQDHYLECPQCRIFLKNKVDFLMRTLSTFELEVKFREAKALESEAKKNESTLQK